MGLGGSLELAVLVVVVKVPLDVMKLVSMLGEGSTEVLVLIEGVGSGSIDPLELEK